MRRHLKPSSRILISAAVGCWLSLSGQAGAAALQDPDYVGEGRFLPKMKVALDVREGRTEVVFRARKVPVVCDDGRQEDVNFHSEKQVRLYPDGRFAQTRGLNDQFGDLLITFFQGKIGRSGRAHGSLLWSYAPADGSQSVCDTGGKVGWVAHRVAG